jgi:hypothetical protein
MNQQSVTARPGLLAERELPGASALAPNRIASHPGFEAPSIVEAPPVALPVSRDVGVSTLRQNAALSMRLRRVAIRSDRPPPLPVSGVVAEEEAQSRDDDVEETTRVPPVRTARHPGLGAPLPASIPAEAIIDVPPELSEPSSARSRAAVERSVVPTLAAPVQRKRAPSSARAPLLVLFAAALSGLAGYGVAYWAAARDACSSSHVAAVSR